MSRFRMTVLIQKKTGEPGALSERWDFDIGSTDGAKALASSLITQRQAFLPANWQIITVRVGTLIVVHPSGKPWRFKQQSVAICNPPTSTSVVGLSDIPGAAVYYSWNYVNKPGRAVVRLHRPLTSTWWKGSTNQGVIDQGASDAALNTWAAWLKGNGHRFFEISQTDGSVQDRVLDCIAFRRSATRKVGRNFFLRRGRRFAHRGTST